MSEEMPVVSWPMEYGKLMKVNPSYVEEEEPETKITLPLQVNQRKKKLLVLNLNGLLLRRVWVHDFYERRFSTARIPEYRYRDFLLFKRPFSKEFLQFCLERFEVGIWSCARGYNIDGALECSIGKLRESLLFVWNQDQCCKTDFRSRVNPSKPLYIKDLAKVWKQFPYSACNTLMIDNKPYRAIFNPPHSSIFTATYDIEDSKDTLLDPHGEFCHYLKQVAETDHVQNYLKHHHFGLEPVSSAHPEWSLYKGIRWRASPYLKLGTFGDLIKVTTQKQHDFEEDFELDRDVFPKTESTEKKLLVMNVNGLLIRKIHLEDMENRSTSRTPDYVYRNSLLFTRPFSREFMRFCLDNFEVAIWSSLSGYNLQCALTCAIGNLKNKVKFVWDKSHCRDSGIPSLENMDKAYYLKEIVKVWEKEETYDSSNTLVIDDKPWKAILNPAYTSIFPESYNIDDVDDSFLDPKGELCKYLKGIAEANHTAEYVKHNPYGLAAVTSKHPEWKYYNRVLPKGFTDNK